MYAIAGTCIYGKLGAFTNSIEADKTPLKGGVSLGSALFTMLGTFFLTMYNIKSYMNQDFITSLAWLMGA